MADHASSDPWDSLAESLGAAPSGNKPVQPERPATPPPPRSRDRQPARKPATPPPSGDWDSIAVELGVSGRDQPPARQPLPPPRQPAAPADRSRSEDEPRRPVREAIRERLEPVAGSEQQPAADADRGPRPARPRRDEAGESDDGSGPRRRRRGRRGGRGRRRDGEGAVGDRGPDRRRDEREPHDLENRPRRIVAEGDHADEEDRPVDRGTGRDGHDLDEPESDRIADGDGPGPRREAAAGGGEDGDRPRKRRRRGRRGGRGRGRGRDADGVERGERDTSSTGAADQLDDEPLPASYGSRPGATTEERPRSGGGAAAGGRGDGEKRSRGRRRRRSGREGAEPRRAGSSGERREPAGDRRERRRKDDSRSSRGRRSDFAPVAGRYEEDDEGLEFLGVEEAARDSDARPRAPAEDDGVLAESGLTSVLDVPSWVEAIGIVIAGNLAARTRSGRGDGGKGR
jgi:ribonuclease E